MVADPGLDGRDDGPVRRGSFPGAISSAIAIDVPFERRTGAVAGLGRKIPLMGFLGSLAGGLMSSLRHLVL